jgi:hypothetical protein
MNAKRTFIQLLLTVSFICAVHTLSAQGQAQQSVQGQQTVPGYVRLMQQSRDGGFSFHVGAAFPMENFGEESNSPSNAFTIGDFSASPGINVGLKGKFPIAMNNGLGVFISADFMYNGLKGLLKDYYENLEISRTDVTRHKYINIPLFAGLNYRYDVTTTFGLWLEAGMGPDFRIITRHETSGQIENAQVVSSYYNKYSYKMQTAFGFQVGGGVMLNDQISIGIHYYGLGRAKIKEEYRKEELFSNQTPQVEIEDRIYNKKSAQNILAIRLGYHF